MFNSAANRRVVCMIALLVASCAAGCEDAGPARSDAGGDVPDVDGGGGETSGNRPPRVTVSAPAQVQRGETIELDASGSTDPDGDTLSYAWSLESSPSRSTSALQNAESAVAKVTADSAGTYSARVVVSDGRTSESETADVSVINRAPDAAASTENEGFVGTPVTLVASDSTDPDGDTLSYEWSFIAKPSESSATIEDAGRAMTTVVPDVDGDYALKVRVSDGVKSDSARVTFTASPTSPETTVYVRASADDANPGTQEAPVATLQKGLAIAANDADIERVDLGASTFDASPTFEISTSLTLLGKGPDKTVLNANNAKGFELDKGGRLHVIDLATVDGTPAVNVSDGARLDANEWRCEGAGACVDTSGTAEESAVSLTDSMFVGDGAPIGLRLEAKSMSATNVTIRGFTVGIASSAGGLRIDKSTIENCKYGLAQGASTSTSLQVLETSFSGNDIGIKTDGARDVTVADSTFRDQSTYGLRLESGGSATIRNSTIEASGRSGIRVSGEVVVTLDGGEILDNGRASPANPRDRAGIYFDDSSHLFDAKGDTDIHGHPRDNIVFEDQSGGTLVEMNVHDAGRAGVYAKTQGTVELEDGRYVDNKYGLYAAGASTVRLRRADINRNARSGIDYRATGELEARGLKLRKNARYQIRISNTPGHVDLGRDSAGGGNLFEMASSSRFAIYDARPALRAATGPVVHAADNIYKNGNYSIWFFNTSSLDGKTFTGPTTWKNTSAGDQKAVFKIEHQNRQIAF